MAPRWGLTTELALGVGLLHVVPVAVVVGETSRSFLPSPPLAFPDAAWRIKLRNFSDTCSGFQTHHGGPADWAVRCEPRGEASSTWADRAQAALSAGHLCPVLHIVGAQ